MQEGVTEKVLARSQEVSQVSLQTGDNDDDDGNNVDDDDDRFPGHSAARSHARQTAGCCRRQCRDRSQGRDLSGSVISEAAFLDTHILILICQKAVIYLFIFKYLYSIENCKTTRQDIVK